jgi:peptidoglycan/LPS O-acetylase OafA/YrhL
MNNGSTYRADIDGLRAVAVLAVLLFHLGVPGFPGGFIGVDIFFVISGYLITGLIQAEIRAGSFTLRRFYLRRVRRLAPALVVVSVPVAIVAFLLLYPEDMRSYAASLAVQFVSLQNFVFLAEGEYFRGAETKLLLHTWTLAVEEQFYLLWPLLLLLTRRVRAAKQFLAIAVLIVVSFGLNLALMRLSPKASFFLLPTRAWELGVGGLIAVLEHQRFFAGWLTRGRRTTALAAAGLAAILASITQLSMRTPFPGNAALLPVVGAALVVVSGIGGTHPLGKALSHPAAVHLGLISYPLYLWHWPLIAGATYLHRDVREPAVAAAILVATVVLAESTYRLVETPIRTRRWLPTPRRLLTAVGGAALVLSAFGVHAWATQGAAYRFPPVARAMLTAPFASRRNRCGTVFRALHPTAQVCSLHAEAPARRRVLLWGNSHGDMWSALFVDLATAERSDLFLNARNCKPTPGTGFCHPGVNAAIPGFITRERVSDVVLASTWYGAEGVRDEDFEADLAKLVSQLSARRVRTWLVIDPPSDPELDPLASYEKNREAPRFGVVAYARYAPDKQRQQALFARLAKANPNVYVIDASTAVCGPEACLGGKGTQAWYRDVGHLTDAGARRARGQFLPVFRASPPR